MARNIPSMSALAQQFSVMSDQQTAAIVRIGLETMAQAHGIDRFPAASAGAAVAPPVSAAAQQGVGASRGRGAAAVSQHACTLCKMTFASKAGLHSSVH